MIHNQPLYQHDFDLTRKNRERLSKNKNLLFWYQRLYHELFSTTLDLESKHILEIGSGTSPLKLFYPQVITSDILNLDYLDHSFDCHQIDQYQGIADNSVDIITLTNVLHHLRDPIQFLRACTRKLAVGGSIYMVEPYFSTLSYPLYKFLHHEPVQLDIKSPTLEQIEGPLSSSNQALPYMIFFSRVDWQKELGDLYDLEQTKISYFTGLSYMMTGGISRNIFLPSWLYKLGFSVDNLFSKLFPRLFASFFIVKLKVLK